MPLDHWNHICSLPVWWLVHSVLVQWKSPWTWIYQTLAPAYQPQQDLLFQLHQKFVLGKKEGISVADLRSESNTNTNVLKYQVIYLRRRGWVDAWSENNLQESVLSCYHMDAVDQTQDSRFVAKPSVLISNSKLGKKQVSEGSSRLWNFTILGMGLDFCSEQIHTEKVILSALGPQCDLQDLERKAGHGRHTAVTTAF